MEMTGGNVHIDAVQTVTPAKETGDSVIRSISGSDQLGKEALQSRITVVVFYRRKLDDKSGWDFAGQLKESLNVALSEQPVFAARLRRNGENLQLKFTDSGARLVQARADVSLSVFSGKRGDVDVSHLAYWVDVDHNNPLFSPLFFVQFTSFGVEGYSIGFSCSLLITDPLRFSHFLRRFGQIHSNMLAGDLFYKTPLFHLSKFRNGQTKSLQTKSAFPHNTPTHKTTLFSATPAGTDVLPMASIASLCFKEAVKSHNGEVNVDPTGMSLFVTGFSGEVNIDHEVGVEIDPKLRARMGAREVDWEEHLDLNKISFEVGIFPVHASCNVESSIKKGLVVVAPDYTDDGGWTSATVSVTVPLAG